MDMTSQDKIEPQKRNEDPRNYHYPNMSSDWQFSNLSSTSMRLISSENPMDVCKGNLTESSSSSSASMVDSFCPTIWDHSTSSQNLGLCGINVQNNVNSSNTLGFRKGSLDHPRTGMERTLDMGWTPPNFMLKGSMLMPTSSTMLPQSLSQFPTDSGFIERAARFSCFSGGNFGDMVSPFSIPESMGPYSRGLAPLQGPLEVFGGMSLKSIPEVQSQKNEMSMAECSKDVSMSGEHKVTGGIPLKNEKNSECFVRPHDEAKQGAGEFDIESDEAELSSGCGHAEPSALEVAGAETSARGHGSKKRKRIGQNSELGQARGASHPPEATKDNTRTQQKVDQNPNSTTNRPSGKQNKQESQASDSLKEEYMHVRARRGQATNSHSLAERVRREKISERMKFLQDLVPGCSKVTGKAVMLDEIINYVQSLQRQVEFLSMKLATVNPRLDFNIEGLLAKDMLQSRAGSSSTLGFHPDMSMPYAPLHPSHPGLIQAGLPVMGTSSESLRRTISSHLTAMSGGYKEPTSQVPNVWEDELHNIVQMGINSCAPLDSQDLDGSLPPGHVKAEL